MEGKSATESFDNSLSLARLAERLGYKRFWMSEHHNMQGVASSATSILIGYIAAGTTSIRVGAGGIMLPNHAPLVVAEQFGTLETLYNGRIDLGLGRAPGTDQLTALALRRDPRAGEDFPANVMELMNYFSRENAANKVRAMPGEGLDIPVWLLGSSTYSAQLAAYLGLPFAFASHFAPQMLETALQVYRENFKPSARLQQPYVMAGINVIAADTDAEAHHLASSVYAFFLNVIRGTSGRLQPPVDIDTLWSPQEEMAARQMLRYMFTGNQQTVAKQLNQFIQQTEVDEIMVVSNIYEHKARLRSYELLAGIKEMNL